MKKIIYSIADFADKNTYGCLVLILAIVCLIGLLTSGCTTVDNSIEKQRLEDSIRDANDARWIDSVQKIQPRQDSEINN